MKQNFINLKGSILRKKVL